MREKRIVLSITCAIVTLWLPAKNAQAQDVCSQDPAAPGCTQWSNLRSSIKGGKAIAVSRDGEHVFVTAPGLDLAYKPDDGTQQWATTNTILDQADLVLSPDGSALIATGESQYVHPTSEFPGREMKTTAYNPLTGAVLWQTEYRGPDLLPHHANAITAGGSRVFITGGRNVPYKMVTVAYDLATGTELWSSLYDAPNEGANRAYVDDAISIGTVSDGSRVFITGLSHRPDGVFYDWATVAYDGQTGQELWVKRLASDGEAHAEPKQLKVHPNGSLVYVTGYADVFVEGPTEGFSNDFVIVAYNATDGAEVWRSTFRPPPAGSDDIAWSLDVSPDGQALFVAGYTEDPTANNGLNGYRILRLDAMTGAQVWIGSVPLLSPTQDDRGLFGHADVRVSADGSEVYLALSAQDDTQIDPATLRGKIVFATLAYRATDGVLLWRNTYDTIATREEYAQRVAAHPAGGEVFVTGLARTGPGDQRLLTIAIATAAASTPPPDPNCLPDSLCPDWVTRRDGPDHLYDHAFDIVGSPDGTRLYVTGASTSSAGALDFLTVAYDAGSGTQLWETRYDGPAHGNDAPAGSSALGKAIVLNGDGSRVFVTGYSADGSGKNEYVTIAYSTVDGAQLWTTRYSTAQESVANALALSGDGQRLYVTGNSAIAMTVPPAPAVANYDYATVAYDTATGNQLWLARYEGPAAFWDISYSVAVGNVPQPDGSRREQVFVTGRSNGASSDNAATDFATVAYEGQTGAPLWVSRYDGPAQDRDLAYAVGASPDGSSIFVTGESMGLGTDSDYATISYDSVTGAQRWAARYAQSDLDLALALDVSRKGDRVAVTGFSVNPGALTVIDRSVATVVYDSNTGGQIWAARHSEIDGAAASRVLFSRNGQRLYVAGLENGNVIGLGIGGIGGQVGHAPALTVAYDATAGDEIWATHYLGATGDEGNSGLAISPDGTHVFVTGGGQGEGADFATLSYSTGASPSGPVSLLGAVSRKTHGSAGGFDLDLPLAGNPVVECRSGGANGDYEVIFTFANTIAGVGDVLTTCGRVAGRSIDSGDAHRYVVDLAGVTCNGQTIALDLKNVCDAAGNVSDQVGSAFGLLIGDTNGDGSVNSADISQTKSQSGNPVDISNFREDVTVDGNLNSADIGLVKSKSGTALP